MWGFNKNKRQNKSNVIKKDGEEIKFRSYTFENEDKIKEHWADNNFIVPHFETWEELHVFLKDETKSIAAKLEMLSNLEGTMPDYFWQDTSLDRKVRAQCRVRSKDYYSKHGSYDENFIYYERLVENLDYELFLGICELQYRLSSLLKCDKVTLEQKALIVNNAINFKRSYNKQEDSHEYVLLEALEFNYFSEDFKKEIYTSAKQNMLTTKKYIITFYKEFFNLFYSDNSVSNEDKIKILKKYLPESNENNYSRQYLLFLGNINIPSFIQEIVLEHFVNATGYNLEHSHPETFKNINATNYINLLCNPEIPFDLKVKFINLTTNPVILCHGMMNEKVDSNLASLLKSKLETLKIQETKEFLEMLKTIITNQEISQNRLIKTQD